MLVIVRSSTTKTKLSSSAGPVPNSPTETARTATMKRCAWSAMLVLFSLRMIVWTTLPWATQIFQESRSRVFKSAQSVKELLTSAWPATTIIYMKLAVSLLAL